MEPHTMHFGHAAANTKFKLQKDELQAIFDDNGYDGKYTLQQRVYLLNLRVMQCR
jgi:hypothetical protein